MKLKKCGEIALLMSLAVTSILLAGCVATQSDVHYSGVENSQLRQIESGRTTRDQLLAIVGEPTEESMTEDGSEILRYKCIEKKGQPICHVPATHRYRR